MLLICNCGGTPTDQQQQQKQQQQHHQQSRSIYIHFLFNFSRMQLRRQITLKSFHIVCLHAGHMYPLLQASSDQEQYYIRSAWHLQSDVSSPWHLQSDTPSCWVIICVQIFRCTWYIWAQTYPIEASGGQEWYYVRSSWHLIILWVRLTFSQMSPSYRHLVMKTGTKLQGIMGSNCCHLLFNYWRCTSYIAMQENELIWVIENWKGNVCRLIFLLLLLMCNFVIVVNL